MNSARKQEFTSEEVAASCNNYEQLLRLRCYLYVAPDVLEECKFLFLFNQLDEWKTLLSSIISNILTIVLNNSSNYNLYFNRS